MKTRARAEAIIARGEAYFDEWKGNLSAMTDQSPIVLDQQESADEDDASIHGASAAADAAHEARPRNVTGVAHLKRGDVDADLARADVVVRETYRFASAHHSFMEPHIAVVRPEPEDASSRSL